MPGHGPGLLSGDLRGPLRDELEAAIAGCAIYFPLFCPIAIYLNRGQLVASGATSWDLGRGLVAVQRPNSLSQYLLTLLVFAPVAAVLIATGAAMQAMDSGAR